MTRTAATSSHASALLRRGVAEAGRGLPAIEPGMPLPAGTGLDRRTFLSRTLGAALTVYGAAALGPRAFDEAIARASAAGHGTSGCSSRSSRRAAGTRCRSSTRAAIRTTAGCGPSIALKPGDGPVFQSDSRLHWHPSLESLAKLHDHGKLTVFPAIGYTHPDQSHFTSRHYWEVGALDPQQGDGLARPPARRDRRRGQRDAGPLARLVAPALARDREDARRDAQRSDRLRLRLAQRLGRPRRAAAGRDRLARRALGRRPTRS